ncbi:M20/M25/M40 family metallo-hydrolase [Roseomonas harenae]|uniref:M20/M25/M40 family metallo-hydrolase n=1 Tax=Muricoccus harenae TaxID=2692566 RepID=UPI001331A134|nr:M20/M25/M40 family metallo-hydrolase [Roseomonas harenae]
MSSREGAIARAERCFDEGRYIAALRRLVAVRTESQRPDSMAELRRYCEGTIPALLDGMGFSSTVVENPKPGFGPVALATRIEDPSRPTVLIYGHGDVVHGQSGRWSEGLDPWSVVERDGRWYGRGVVDNKGQHLIAIEALRAILQERGRLGFNAKIFIETGEEVGSPGLRELIASEPDRFAADFFIGLDGPRQARAVPELRLGARGGVAFDLVVQLREHAAHSGHWGGVLADPGFILSHALSSIVTRDGRILVDGWTPKQIPDAVRRACAGLVFEDIPGLPQPDTGWGEPGLSKAERIYAWTSVIVLSFITGHPDAPTNAVQPEARARLQVRHTVEVDGTEIIPALRRHLEATGLGQVRVTPVAERDTFPAGRTDPDNDWVTFTAASLQRTAGQAPNMVPNSSGGNPTEVFLSGLGAPVLWIPSGYAGSNQHAPDEHGLPEMLRDGLRLMTGVWWDLGDLRG